MSVLTVLQLIPALLAGFLILMVRTLGTVMRVSGSGSLCGLSWLIPCAPALNEFVMFVLQAVLSTAALVCALLQVSNHIILTLDILYLFSISMLTLFHTRKVACNLH